MKKLLLVMTLTVLSSMALASGASALVASEPIPGHYIVVLKDTAN